VPRITYTNVAVLPSSQASSLTQRLIGLRAPDREISIPPAPSTRLVSGVLAAEAAALRVLNIPLDGSLLALAQKLAPVGV